MKPTKVIYFGKRPEAFRDALTGFGFKVVHRPLTAAREILGRAHQDRALVVLPFAAVQALIHATKPKPRQLSSILLAFIGSDDLAEAAQRCNITVDVYSGELAREAGRIVELYRKYRRWKDVEQELSMSRSRRQKIVRKLMETYPDYAERLWQAGWNSRRRAITGQTGSDQSNPDRSG